MRKIEIDRIYVDRDFKKKLEIESINGNFRNLIDFTHHLAQKDDPLANLFNKERKNDKKGFDFI